MQTLSWGSTSRTQVAQLGKPDRGRRSEGLHLFTQGGLLSQAAIILPHKGGDSGRRAALHREVPSLASMPALGLATLPHPWEAALTSRCGAGLRSLVSCSDGLSTHTECFSFFKNILSNRTSQSLKSVWLRRRKAQGQAKSHLWRWKSGRMGLM